MQYIDESGYEILKQLEKEDIKPLNLKDKALKHTVKQYGSYISCLMVAASPVLGVMALSAGVAAAATAGAFVLGASILSAVVTAPLFDNVKTTILDMQSVRGPVWAIRTRNELRKQIKKTLLNKEMGEDAKLEKLRTVFGYAKSLDKHLVAVQNPITGENKPTGQDILYYEVSLGDAFRDGFKRKLFSITEEEQTPETCEDGKKLILRVNSSAMVA